MELPELSLAPSWSRLLTPECSSSDQSSDYNTSSSRKRKAMSDTFLETKSRQATQYRNVIDLQHISERLPLDWEQCLDLESGKMYFLNRKTLKKSWDRPTTKDQFHHQHNINQKLDLELNISSPVSSKPKPNQLSPMKRAEQPTAQPLNIITKREASRSISTFAGIANYNHMLKSATTTTSIDNMVAMACMNCHMLVIVSNSSPTCPNCKFLHTIPQPAAKQASPSPATRNPSTATTTFKPLDTLTLFS